MEEERIIEQRSYTLEVSTAEKRMHHWKVFLICLLH
jgi:hypothetical protein